MEKNDSRMAILGVLILLIALAGAAAGGRPGKGGGEGPVKVVLTPGILPPIVGSGNENTDTDYNLTINATNIVNVTVMLNWKDESDITDFTGRHQNQPDELGVTAISPEGESKTSSARNARAASGGTGSTSVTFAFNVTEKDASTRTSRLGTGSWDISVHVGACGDQTPVFGPGIVRTIADNSNAFTLTVTYQCYASAAGGK